MALTQDARFGLARFDVPAARLAELVADHRDLLPEGTWIHCGFADLEGVLGGQRPSADVSETVDSGFRLGPVCGFETAPVVVTTGVRGSRFAAVIFWEVLHVLRPGGVWIDIDLAERCQGGPLTAEDFLDRTYFRRSLAPDGSRRSGPLRAATYRKTSATPLAARIDDDGWTFGILTSGDSARAAQMATAIRDLDLPRLEVIFCGPRPSKAPVDDCIRAIDLERPEPRGWISRKKNLLADAATHENLCLLHDRFVVTPAWATALRGMQPVFAISTFPQVFYADRDRRFTQRYADYQVLYQHERLREAHASNVYVGERVFYAPYDDFYETAFCCGGLYLAKRSLWTDVRQDESLYHCEWEDLSFGLACQMRGIPHRVHRGLTVESLAPHPMALTRFHDMVEPDTPVRGRLHVVPEQARAAAATPGRFKPVLPTSRADYYRKVIARLNQMPGLAPHQRLSPSRVTSCVGLSDFWAVIERHLGSLAYESRDWFAEVSAFLSATIYGWPNCEALAAIRDNQRECDPAARSDARRHLRRVKHLVGWGTGSLFATTHATLERAVDFVVDRDPARWGTERDGVQVKSPDALRRLDPSETAVVIFSCEFDAVAAAVLALGTFPVVSVADVATRRTIHPLREMVAHFEEVERYYPILFLDSVAASDSRCAA